MPTALGFADFETSFADFAKIADFETAFFADFESRDVAYWAVSCIQAVTVCPMRCLKARLKVL